MSIHLKAMQLTGSYNSFEQALFEKQVQLKNYRRGDVLLAQGNVADSVYFLASGAIVQRVVNEDETPHIIDLHTEGEWFLNHLSFVSQSPSGSEIIAHSDSVVLELSINAIHFLISKSAAFLQLNRVLNQATARLLFFDFSLTPLQKYNYVFEQKPHLLQHFPLKLIASYLKISPETLSRVREQFGRSKTFLDLNQAM